LQPTHYTDERLIRQHLGLLHQKTYKVTYILYASHILPCRLQVSGIYILNKCLGEVVT